MTFGIGNKGCTSYIMCWHMLYRPHFGMKMGERRGRKQRGEEGEGESERSLDISKSPKTVDECKV